MLAMAKKQPKTEAPGRARERGEVSLLQVEISLLLDKAVEDCRHDERRTRKALVELALEAYLKQRGFWPPGESP